MVDVASGDIGAVASFEGDFGRRLAELGYD